jgi:pyruvate/2-oxoglutarate/acetoin dehydrogenase E1 component
VTGRQAAEAALEGTLVLGERVDPSRGTRTPLSEGAVIGVATGMALAGKRVVVDLVDAAGVTRAADALADAADVRRRSRGAWSAPLVVRVPVTAGPLPVVPAGVGVTVVGRASRLADALTTALGAEGPAIVFETAEALDADVDDTVLPTGTDVTVLALGAGVPLAVVAAASLEGERSVGVVDLGGFVITAEAAEAVRSTGRFVLVTHGGEGLLGAAMSAAFWSLEAPPVEVRAEAGVDAVVAAIRSTFEE